MAETQFMEMRAETPSLHKTQSRTEVPSYCIAGRQGTMVPCTGRDGPRTDRIQVALLHARCSTYKGGLDTGHDGALCRRGGRAMADLGL